MRKYWAVAKTAWQNIAEYRANLVGHAIAHLLTLFCLIYLWRAIFVGRLFFGSYSLGAIISYFIMTKFLHFANRGDTSRRIADEIKQGDLSLYLLKPWSYLKCCFAVTIAERLFQAIVDLAIVSLFLILIPQYFSFSLGRFNSFPFLVSVGLALIINFFLNMLVAETAFWITDIRLFSTSFFLIINALAGLLIPLDLFPPPLNKVSMFLPFSYLLYFPIKIYQGSFSQGEIQNRILLGFVWAWLLTYVVKFIWRKGLRRYEAVGR